MAKLSKEKIFGFFDKLRAARKEEEVTASNYKKTIESLTEILTKLEKMKRELARKISTLRAEIEKTKMEREQCKRKLSYLKTLQSRELPRRIKELEEQIKKLTEEIIEKEKNDVEFSAKKAKVLGMIEKIKELIFRRTSELSILEKELQKIKRDESVLEKFFDLEKGE